MYKNPVTAFYCLIVLISLANIFEQGGNLMPLIVSIIGFCVLAFYFFKFNKVASVLAYVWIISQIVKVQKHEMSLTGDHWNGVVLYDATQAIGYYLGIELGVSSGMILIDFNIVSIVLLIVFSFIKNRNIDVSNGFDGKE
jgi:hypothetical protein